MQMLDYASTESDIYLNQTYNTIGISSIKYYSCLQRNIIDSSLLNICPIFQPVSVVLLSKAATVGTSQPLLVQKSLQSNNLLDLNYSIRPGSYLNLGYTQSM